MKIRPADPNKDFDPVWEIFQKVISTGDTYVFAPDTPRKDLIKHWFAPGMNTFVAETGASIAGTYILKPNQIGLGAHIANTSYMVHPDYRGQGIGRRMGEHSIHFARQQGFRGIQFNLVVSTNTAAIRLWHQLGWKTVGTIPGGFRHATLGYVDTLIMYREV